jgi:hypothetical protein
MLAPGFDKLNFELGQQYLEPEGYKYENGNWHLLNDDYQLSFILAKDKNASHFQIKYLTVAIRHREVPMGDDKVKLVPYNDLNKGAPVQISPFKLNGFISSNFSEESWKNVNAFSTRPHANTYYPLYYGGLDKWVLKDKSLPREQNLKHLKRSINLFEAELISEDETQNLLQSSMIQVAKYAQKWAEVMTPTEIVRQLKENGEGWWVENQWINSYCETFHLDN